MARTVVRGRHFESVPQLLLVHHLVSPGLHTLAEALVEGTGAEGIEGVEVASRPALSATADDVLRADGIVLGTPANLGYMSGALKHFFDTVYYPCLGVTRGLVCGAWVHGDNDTGGAVLAIDKILTGLEWRLVQPVLSLAGPVDAAARDATWELGAAVAATLMPE